MRLGEHISIMLDGERITLRPSLRAAVLLDRRHGLDRLPGLILDGHATAIADTIAACGEHQAPEEVLQRLTKAGILAVLASIVPDLLVVSLGLVGVDPDADPDVDHADDEEADEPRVTYAEAHTKLYRIATGWLGWTPAETWAASPLEIRTAYEGRTDMLRAIFGSEDKPKSKAQREGSLDDKFAALIARNATLSGATAG